LDPAHQRWVSFFYSKLRLQQQGPDRDAAQRIVRKKQRGDCLAALLAP
jgi:hypothetical protein